MFKALLGGLLESGTNPNIEEIPVNQPEASKTDWATLAGLGVAMVLLIAVLYFTTKK